MRVVIIGSGHVATILATAIQKGGHTIDAVWARNETEGKKLANKLQASYESIRSTNYSKADLHIIAVADVAIKEILPLLPAISTMVVHTAGSVEAAILSEVSKNFGVLYPLQSLRKELEVPLVIPVLIDSNTPDGITLLQDFASTFSSTVRRMGDEQRRKIHVAAVMVNNFSNFIFTSAHDFCAREHLDFDLLLPLIQQTTERLEVRSPELLQTGPAVRNDEATVQAHLAMLDKHPIQRKLYEFLTETIITWYGGARKER